MPKTIAIVDDDEAVRDSLAALLTSAGYEVDTYGTSSAFLRAVQRNRPDGVILDHQMIGTTGVEAAEQLGRGKSQMAIVMISGNLTDAVQRRAKYAGVAAILEKPFSDETLIEILEGLFGSKGSG
ncbi:MAG: response regulator [Alphaproteobacteria bacterium]